MTAGDEENNNKALEGRTSTELTFNELSHAEQELIVGMERLPLWRRRLIERRVNMLATTSRDSIAPVKLD